jgi:pimeloyl-[acyl-carrier protein] methyl ester esterase
MAPGSQQAKNSVLSPKEGTELLLADGGCLVYDDVGPCDDSGNGRPIVFIHGWAMGAALFAPQRAALGRRFRVITPDLRGHGRSSRLEPGQGLQTLADDLAQLIRQLDLENALLCGWSLGAMVAWDALLRHGAGRIAGLVIEDMTPRIPGDAAWSLGLLGGHDEAASARAITAMEQDWVAFCPVFVPRIFARNHAESRQDLVRRTIRQAEKCDPASMALLWRSMIRQDFRPALASLQTPSWVLYGAQSRLYAPATSGWLEETIPHAKRISFANSGHAPHMEEPEAFNRIIESIADTLSTTVTSTTQP